MPVVVVHGIGNHDATRFRQQSQGREALLRRLLLPAVTADPGGARVWWPFWGDLVPEPRMGGASVPKRGFGERLSVGGTADDDGESLLAAAIESASTPETTADTVLLDLASRSFEDAVDLLMVSFLEDVDPSRHPEALHLAASLVAYCRGLSDADSGRRIWGPEVVDDTGWVRWLLAEASGWDLAADGTPVRTRQEQSPETLNVITGIGGRAVGATRRLKRLFVTEVEKVPTGALRHALRGQTTLLLRDVLAYLAQRETADAPGPVVEAVARDLAEACAARGEGEPLVVLAHSMGGNIVYDILSHYRPDLTVDVLVTIGSQTGYFEELGLFHAAGAGASRTDRTAVPSNILRWINVADEADPLAFLTEPVFDRTEDFSYRSGALWAHSAYLRQPMFLDRLARRLAAPAGRDDRR